MNGFNTSVTDGVRIIKFDNLQRRNSLSYHTYKGIGTLLNEDAENDHIVVTVITGTGEYFCSGNDMKSLLEVIQQISTVEELDEKCAYINLFINALINYPKIIIAVVNGPAIGIGTTILGLCDVIYASDRAYFRTPFTELHISIEACASYTFPRIMGKSKAFELLLLGHKLTAQEAYECGFIAKVVPHAELDHLMVKLQEYGKFNAKIVRINKQLMVDSLKKTLGDTWNREFEIGRRVLQSDVFLNNIKERFTHQSKL